MNQRLAIFYGKWYEHLAKLRDEVESGDAIANIVDQHPALRGDLVDNIDALQVTLAAMESLARRATEDVPEAPPAVAEPVQQRPGVASRAAQMFAARR